ncbi:MAG: NfeD family protein [Sulfurovaceae bacterium]|nr:NfeD family protein [Sulfurovaceae bacterium]MDD5548812.1 NfeD family protein [Sulfurovaceae bacterium]
MIDFLNEVVLWWHWIILGILLIIIELGIGTFFILGLGIGAILVGILDLLIGLSFTGALGLWILFSIVAIIIWFKYYKETTISTSGQSNKSFDTIGTVSKEIKAHGRGEVVFDTPVLGNTSWDATSKHNIEVGSRVTIKEINGQLIVVEENK